MPSQLVPLLALPGDVPRSQLCFLAQLPALGHATYVVSTTEGDVDYGIDTSAAPSVVIANPLLIATFDGATGELAQLQSVIDATTTPVRHSFVTYNDVGNAYQFVPWTNASTPVDASNVSVTVVRGPVVSAVYQVFSPTLAHVYRLYNCSSCLYVEAEVVVGPLDVNTAFVAKMATGVQSGATFYTGV